MNAHLLPSEFKQVKPLEAKLEDLMMIQKESNSEKDDAVLPNIIRDLIIHDRGNSLFLSDSFANLPSPVNETKNLK